MCDMLMYLQIEDLGSFVVYIVYYVVRISKTVFNCWRALARQLPILSNSEKKAKSVECKIEDMSSRLCLLYPGIPGCL